MGEKDAEYGRPKRGLVVSPAMEIAGGLFRRRSRYLEPQELRLALLFWDHLVWPSSRNFHFDSGPDEQFLESAGILTRPDYTVDGDLAQGIAAGQIQAFLDLDQREPGVWALAQGENSLLLRDQVLQEGNGAFVELTRAIPIPDKDVPLNEILEFKGKRHDELQLLRNELDNVIAALNEAQDKDAELSKRLTEIDAACADALRVGKEWRFPVRLSNLKLSTRFAPIKGHRRGLRGIPRRLGPHNAAHERIVARRGGCRRLVVLVVQNRG